MRPAFRIDLVWSGIQERWTCHYPVGQDPDKGAHESLPRAKRALLPYASI